ncbi:SDR family oxidoreductase [Pseudoxanthomonas sp.]|uniref:SDR family NAD(P)-dependent oxidoreductase n=1 Tax=Pseudoxanthomonas sp. TaxID=1871049 RepID=UPI00260C3D6B|nr:SDR family oxidoreductase [Pseudoxanthomonas sp.]WDS35049.1 MAG: SDR family NAD(P)-dependent oxidoreductase [Pseudoxanthomonas sp.]
MTADARAVAVVTGGAGGLGAAICQSLAQAGLRVVVTYRSSADAARALAATLPGDDHLALPASVTDSTSLQALATSVQAACGRADVLVNCAGTTRFVAHADLDGLDDALIDEILSTNVRGAIAATRALLPLLRESQLTGGGVVINISSIAARTGMGSNIAYCASKAALDNLTLSLARALAPQVRVLSVAPGLVDTEFVKSLDVEWRDRQCASTPLGRLAEPAEIGRAVVVAVRDLTFSTGCILPVDGGRPLG